MAMATPGSTRPQDRFDGREDAFDELKLGAVSRLARWENAAAGHRQGMEPAFAWLEWPAFARRLGTGEAIDTATRGAAGSIGRRIAAWRGEPMSVAVHPLTHTLGRIAAGALRFHGQIRIGAQRSSVAAYTWGFTHSIVASLLGRPVAISDPTLGSAFSGSAVLDAQAFAKAARALGDTYWGRLRCAMVREHRLDEALRSAEDRGLCIRDEVDDLALATAEGLHQYGVQNEREVGVAARCRARIAECDDLIPLLARHGPDVETHLRRAGSRFAESSARQTLWRRILQQIDAIDAARNPTTRFLQRVRDAVPRRADGTARSR